MVDINLLKQTLSYRVSTDGDLQSVARFFQLILPSEHPAYGDISAWGNQQQSAEEDASDLPSLDPLYFIHLLKESDLIDEWYDLEEVKLMLGPIDEKTGIPDEQSEATDNSIPEEDGIDKDNAIHSENDSIHTSIEPDTEQINDLAGKNIENEKDEVTDVASEDTESNQDEVKDVISVKVLKERLLDEVIVKDNFDYSFEIMQRILKDDSRIRKDYVLIHAKRKELEKQEKMGTLHRNDYTIELSKIRDSLLTYFTDELNESELREDWNTSELLEPLFKGFFEEKAGEESYTFQEVAIHLVDIEMPTSKDKKGASDEEIKIHKFRQWMIKSQDEIGAGDYPLAYEYAEKASKIIGFLPQVYEFLMISFLRKETPRKIIHNALDGDDSSFKRLCVYADKLKFLGNITKEATKSPQKKKTTTYQNSLQEASYILIWELRHQYLSVRYDYMNELARDKESARTTIRNIFELVQKVYDISPSMVFLNMLQIELAGASKLDWMRVDKNFNLVNKTSFDAIKYWTYLEKVQNQALSLQGREIEKKRTTDKIYFPLIKKYSAIRYDRYETDAVKNSKRKKIIKIIEAWKVAFKILNDNRFIEKAIRELEGDEKFEWLILNDNGKLDQHFACSKLGDGYDPVSELTIIRGYIDGDKASEKIKYLEKSIAEEKANGADIIYNKLVEKRQQSLHSNLSDEKEDRTVILRCIRNWRINYCITRDVTMLDKCVHELSGQGCFHWLEASKNGQIILTTPKINTSPLFELKKILEIEGLDIEVESKKFVASSFFNRIFREYQKYSEDEVLHNLSYLIDLLQKARSCYTLSNNHDYLIFVYKEFFENKKSKWFKQLYLLDRHVVLPAPECLKYRFDPIAEFENLKIELEIN